MMRIRVEINGIWKDVTFEHLKWLRAHVSAVERAELEAEYKKSTESAEQKRAQGKGDR